jgi:O-antigen ligase
VTQAATPADRTGADPAPLTPPGPGGDLTSTPDSADGYQEPRATYILKAGIFLTFAGIVVLRPALPHNTAFVDPLIAVMCFAGILKMTRRGSPATLAAGRCMPWMWIILIGSLLGLAGVGLAFWGTSDLVVTYVAFLSFFAYWHIMYMTRIERFAIYGTVVGMIVVDFALVSGSTAIRQQAYFAQPNYPGNYIVMAAAIMFFYTKSFWLRAFVVASVVIAILETGSFGAIALVATYLLVLAWRSIAKHSAILVLALVLLLAGTAFYATGAPQSATSGGIQVNSAINTTRFDKSQSSRFQLWAQGWDALVHHPFGVGPGGVLSRKLAFGGGFYLPIHNDMLSYLVERGPIGLIGLIGLWVAIWKRAKPKGMARLLIVGIVVSGLFRQTMHYRHMWLFLALAFVLDSRRTERDALEAAEAEQSLALEA